MVIQYIIVLLVIGAAAALGVSWVWRSAKSFRAKPGCDAGCGCSGTSKKLNLKD